MSESKTDLLAALDAIRSFIESKKCSKSPDETHPQSGDRLPQEDNIHRFDDEFGDPVEFTQGWSFSGHRSRTDAEKEDLAREALDGKCRQFVLEKQAQGKNIDFDHSQLVRIDGGWSETEQSWTGERTHKCGGTAVGYLFFRRR